MQQYFADQPLVSGMTYELTPEQAHHAGTVLRMDGETIRLVYDGQGYFAVVHRTGKKMTAEVIGIDPEPKELPLDITLAMALIRREKLELVLQKAAEVGISRIILFESSRCVVHARNERLDRQLERWRSILQEASEQCKRDRIPELIGIVPFAQLPALKQGTGLLAYEKAGMEAYRLSTVPLEKACTVVIGPEGGFAPEEADRLLQAGFVTVSLGRRILRAETAAIYAGSVLAERAESGAV